MKRRVANICVIVIVCLGMFFMKNDFAYASSIKENAAGQGVLPGVTKIEHKYGNKTDVEFDSTKYDYETT